MLDRQKIGILKSTRLTVFDELISVEVLPPPPEFSEVYSQIAKDFPEKHLWTGGRFLSAATPLVALNVGGGKLHKGLHKALHKGLHKGLHKSSGVDSPSGTVGQQWPEIEVPWRELNRLYERKDTYEWDHLPLEPPLPIEERLDELREVRCKLEKLRGANQAWRRSRIVSEAGNDLTAYMDPLGLDSAAPNSATAVMFQTILWLGAAIGLQYKARFNSERPNALDPQIEPFIPVPVYSAYPSNHSFQSHLIAEVFARAVPEHPGILALFRAAWDVSENREYAGLHIRSETLAGQKLARMCAPLFEEVFEKQIANVRKEWYQ